jgi:hypothetical protein
VCLQHFTYPVKLFGKSRKSLQHMCSATILTCICGLHEYVLSIPNISPRFGHRNRWFGFKRTTSLFRPTNLTRFVFPRAKNHLEPHLHPPPSRLQTPTSPTWTPQNSQTAKLPLPRLQMASLRSAARCVARPRTLHFTTARAFSSSHISRAGGHESHYDPPTGWLFGVKPGEKYEKEGWEGPMYFGFCGGAVLAVIAYAFKPDTRYVCEYAIEGDRGWMRGKRRGRWKRLEES